MEFVPVFTFAAVLAVAVMAYLLGRFHTRRKLLNHAYDKGRVAIGTTVLSVRVVGTAKPDSG